MNASNELPLSPDRMSLIQALQLWVEITGVEPARSGSFTMGEWGIQKLHREIQESLELDPSEITGLMMFSSIVQSYFEDRTFTLDALLNNPDRVNTYLSKARTLTAFLRSDAVTGPSDAFANRVSQALEKYGVTKQEVSRILSNKGQMGDRGTLAVLRRDAMRTLEHLQVNQFLDGDAEEVSVKPAYGRFVYRWDNINSMLRAMVNAPSGVTINMIQTAENPLGVYFVFAIRNGGRLFVFTDKEATPHPLAEGMWRRPDKILAARANRNWFPYELAGLKFNEEGRAYIEMPEGRSIVQYQNKALPISPISELSAPQIIWISMMLDLIVDKFWHQAHREKKLSYTGEMVRVASPLIEAARAAQLPLALRSEQTMQTRPITVADVHTDRMKAAGHLDEGGAAGDCGDNAHRWLEERYAHRVLPESIDLVSAGSQDLLVPFESKDAPAKGRALVVGHGGMISREELEKAITFSFDRNDALRNMAEVSSYKATEFGTQEEIERDRLFIARANYASQIDTMADIEFRERKKDIVEWVRARVQSNIEALRPLMALTEGCVATQYQGSNVHESQAFGVRYFQEQGRRAFVTRTEITREVKENFLYEVGSTPIMLGRMPLRSGLMGCAFHGSVASHLIRIVPETTEQLAWLCGVEVSGLPDVLQHWTQLTKRHGNIILNRVDPMQGMVKDPWNGLHFRVCAMLSKRALAQIEKEHSNSVRPSCWEDAPGA